MPQIYLQNFRDRTLTQEGYPHPLSSKAPQWVQTRASDGTLLAQYGHACRCTACEAQSGTKNSTRARGPNTSPALYRSRQLEIGACSVVALPSPLIKSNGRFALYLATGKKKG